MWIYVNKGACTILIHIENISFLLNLIFLTRSNWLFYNRIIYESFPVYQIIRLCIFDSNSHLSNYFQGNIFLAQTVLQNNPRNSEINIREFRLFCMFCSTSSDDWG